MSIPDRREGLFNDLANTKLGFQVGPRSATLGFLYFVTAHVPSE